MSAEDFGNRHCRTIKYFQQLKIGYPGLFPAQSRPSSCSEHSTSDLIWQILGSYSFNMQNSHVLMPKTSPSQHLDTHKIDS